MDENKNEELIPEVQQIEGLIPEEQKNEALIPEEQKSENPDAGDVLSQAPVTKKKGKAVKVIVLLLVLAALAAGGVFAFKKLVKKDAVKPGELVYVNAVSEIAGGAYMNDNRYMGVVEAQETKSIQKDSDKKVKEVFVQVEDEVKKGDKLFEYDTEEMNLKLKQMELELSRINNSIATMNQQISSLAQERDEAPPESRLSYTAQIQNLQAQINQSNYEVSAKQLEIENQKKAMENSVVVSPMNGIIKEIKSDDGENTNNNDYDFNNVGSDDNAYMKIMAKGEYRIKAKADEVSVRSMSQGDPVICYARIGEPMSWRGTVSTIDLEHPDNGGGNNDYYYGGGGAETTTDYPFYIQLEDTTGLMLGQHVYVEPDNGQGEIKEGIWLDDFYLMQDDSGAYVWAEKDGVIEKRKVELGDFDENLLRYQIVSGLTESDYIAFPEDRITEGMTTTRNIKDLENTEEEQQGQDPDMDVDVNPDMNADDIQEISDDYYKDDVPEEDLDYYENDQDVMPDEDAWTGEDDPATGEE